MKEDYIPERDDYLNWKDDWDKLSIYDDGTHNKIDGNKKIWMNKVGKISRNPGPAIITPNELVWYDQDHIARAEGKYTKDGDLDLPAYVSKDGTRRWYHPHSYSKDIHRNFARPALIQSNGYKEWYEHGLPYTPSENILKKCIEFDIRFLDLFFNQSEWKFFRGALYQYKKSFSKEFQKYVLEKNPSLVSKIPNIDNDIKKEYEAYDTLNGLGL